MDDPRTARDLYVLDDGCCPHGSLLDLAAYRRKVQRESLRLARDAVADLLRRWGYDVHEDFCVPARQCTCRHQIYTTLLAAIDRRMENPK